MASPIIKKALYFAAEKHDGQYRKGGQVPYIVHPVQTAFSIQAYTNDEETIAAAFLHDVLEDCSGVSLALLQKEFGNRIAQLVDEVSIIEDGKYKNWKEKKQAYLEKIKKASQKALLIIAVDKMNNLESYFSALLKNGDAGMDGFSGKPDEYRWYYTEIGNILMSALGEHPAAKDYATIWQLYKDENL